LGQTFACLWVSLAHVSICEIVSDLLVPPIAVTIAQRRRHSYAVGTTRFTLYQLFDGKEGLYAAALD
jgi:hypothetical protein